MEIEQFLKDNGKYLNLAAIEIACNIANGTTNHYLKGKRNLTDANKVKLNNFFADWFDRVSIPKQPIETKKDIIKPLPRVKQSDLNNYQLLLSGNYTYKQTGDIITVEQFNTIKKAT